MDADDAVGLKGAIERKCVRYSHIKREVVEKVIGTGWPGDVQMIKAEVGSIAVLYSGGVVEEDEGEAKFVDFVAVLVEVDNQTEEIAIEESGIADFDVYDIGNLTLSIEVLQEQDDRQISEVEDGDGGSD